MIENVNLPMGEEGNLNGPSREERLIAAICYAPFGFLAPIFLGKSSDFLTPHMRQGAIIFVSWFILNLLPLGLSGLFFLIYIGLAGYAAKQAYDGLTFTYPFVDAALEQIEKLKK